VARPGWRAPVPVICCGNPGAGGSGKTPLALDLAIRLIARGRRPAFLTRGHGGSLRGPIRVDLARHDAAASGDEAQLLAAVAPTWLGADRAATARLAVGQGADVLVMDDGLQNPGLAKTLSLLVIDGGAGFGNGRVIPAGPLREPVAAAAARCRAAVLIGKDATDATGMIPDLTLCTAEIAPDPTDLAALPPKILAFAGIGRPEKFFETLHHAGHTPADTIAFPDHHRFTERDLHRIHQRADACGATPVTTQKDFARLTAAQRSVILQLRIRLLWQDAPMIERLLDEALS
jgi:tetraacyldisaccharide 4'-kinase